MADKRVVISRIDQANFQMEILLEIIALFSKMGPVDERGNNPYGGWTIAHLPDDVNGEERFRLFPV